jgi:hypothetical protein
MTNDEQERLVIVPKSVFDNLGEIGKQLEKLDLHLQALVALHFASLLVLGKCERREYVPKTEGQKEVIRILKEFGISIEQED